jgi:ribonuclease HI
VQVCNSLSTKSWEKIKHDIITTATQKVKEFQGGQLTNHLKYWKTITNNRNILEYVEGIKLDFLEIPKQTFEPKPFEVTKELRQKINAKLQEYLNKEIIQKVYPEKGHFISNIFTKQKKDGDIRIVLDVSNLNDYIEDEHFKMEGVREIKTMIKRNSFMASIDWKDAYYTVNLDSNFRKYFRFYWEEQLYQFTCAPNGLKSVPRIFTKLTRALMAEARRQGAKVSPYLDDSIIGGDNLTEGRINVITLCDVSEKSGFVVHPVKSNLDPEQIIDHLGYIWNSEIMTLQINSERKNKILKLAIQIRSWIKAKIKIKIQTIAQLNGCIVSSLPANPYGGLQFKSLEIFVNQQLRFYRGNYKARVTVPQQFLKDVQGIIETISHTSAPIIREPPEIFITSDASFIGWGASMYNPNGSEIMKTGGNWFEKEIDKMINYLELQAAIFAYLSFCRSMRDRHVLIQIDNKTAISYINKQGGRKKHLNDLAKSLWKNAKRKNMWITAVYIPGKENSVADEESRKWHDNLEWELSRKMFDTIVGRFWQPEIDLFASRLNHKVPIYASWKHDPYAAHVNAFNISWTNLQGYAFPPFNQIGKVLQKVVHEKANIILICPDWPNQVWYTEAIKLADKCIYFSREEVTHSFLTDVQSPAVRLIAIMINCAT